jgi:hypothetical protein
MRLDVPIDDPRFGRPVRCPDQRHRVQQLNRLSSLSQMHPRDLELRLSHIKAVAGNQAMLDACRRMLHYPWGWLYIWGGPGSAKSMALKAMCNHLALKGYHPVVYIKFSRLVDIMRDAYAERQARERQLADGVLPGQWVNMGYLERFDRLRQIRVLAIEEFDKERLTAFAERFRFDFLDERYEQALRGDSITLFAGNSSPAGLPSPLRSRIEDGRFRVAKNSAGDARPNLKRTTNDELS